MTMDEERWPGPSWDFTIHQSGFPSHRVTGDIYINSFGQRYICLRGQYEPLSEEEWLELLDPEPEMLMWDEFVLDGKTHIVRLGHHVLTRRGNTYTCIRSPNGDLVLEAFDKSKGLILIVESTRKKYVPR